MEIFPKWNTPHRTAGVVMFMHKIKRAQALSGLPPHLFRNRYCCADVAKSFFRTLTSTRASRDCFPSAVAAAFPMLIA